MNTIQTFARANQSTHSLLLKRTRLSELVDSCRNKPLTWISGPAGSGKTTLAASYVDDRDLNCFWYTCEEADNDLATFFYHLRASGNRLFEARKRKLPLLQPEYALGIPTFGKNFFGTLFSKITTPGLLVIDDYHLIAADSRLHDIIRRSLDDLPEGLGVAIISRQPPPPIFGRLRVESRLAEITPTELMFTLKESEALVRLRKKNKFISADNLKRWHDKTQGWIAGLVLFIDRSNNNDTVEADEEDIATEHIFDYFAGELFDALEPSEKQFLATVSLLKVFTASNARELTGNLHARQILRDFSARQLFVSRRGRFNPEYKFHPLLCEFLSAQLEEMQSGEEFIRLKKQAASILESADQWVDAASIYYEINDHHALTQLLKTAAPKAIKQGRHKTLEHWISNLPEPILEQEPWLRYWLGLSKVQFDPIDAQPHFESALSTFLKGNDARGAYLSWAGLADSFAFGVHSFVIVREWLIKFEKMRQRWPRYPGFEVRARVVFSTLNLLVFISIDREETKNWVSSAERLLRIIPIRPLQIAFGMELGIHYNITGQVGKIRTSRALFYKISKNKNAAPMERIIAYAGIAASTWSTPEHEYADGLAAVECALQIANDSGIHVFDPITSAQAVYLCLQSNDLKGVKKYIECIDELKETNQYINRAHYLTLRSHLESELGDHAAALEHAVESVKITEEYAPGMMPEFPFRCVLGLQLIEMGRHEEGMRHLMEAEKMFSKMDSAPGNFMVFSFKARSALLQRNFEAAATFLKQGLEIARIAEVTGFGHWRPSVMVSLLQFALERRIETDYARKLIRLSHLIPKEPPFNIPDWPWAVQIYTLGGFKLYTNDELVTFKRKTQKKPLDLLKAIIARGGENIAIESLIDELWPDSEGDAAKSVFDSTLHRLRKLLASEKVITLRDGHLSLDFRRCWVDTFALNRTMESISKEDSEEDLHAHVDSILDIYQGDFLAGEQEAWMLSRREHIKNKAIQKLRSLIAHAIGSNNLNGLDEGLERILEVFPDSELFYELLMRFHVGQGRKADAVSTYQRCERILQSALGVSPSTDMKRLHDAVKNATS